MPALKSLLSLTRYRLSLSVSLSAVVGYVQVSCSPDIKLLTVFSAVFFLSCGASALNQVQEKDYDSKMTRTLKRPLPLGLLSLRAAILSAFLLVVPGLVILFFAGGFKVFFLGLLSIVWYNGLYTGLKRRTAYAVFPGSLTGVFPILIGWFAAGGDPSGWNLYCISFFMAMWQVPHFLLLMHHYNRDYKLAGFPTFSDFFNDRQLKGQIFIWTTGVVVASFLLIFFQIIQGFPFKVLLIFSGLSIIILFTKELFLVKNHNYKLLFIAINCYMLIVMLLLLGICVTTMC